MGRGCRGAAIRRQCPRRRPLAALCFILPIRIVVTSQWERATVTVGLCSISVVIACPIGVPLAIRASTREPAWRIVGDVIDALQNPAERRLSMPVVMLFRVGNFTAIVAVVVYSVALVIRYAGHGIRAVDPQRVEAGVVSGCTPFQIRTRMKLKLALPEMILGLNQTIMLAISMLVVPAAASLPVSLSPSSPIGCSRPARNGCARAWGSFRREHK